MSDDERSSREALGFAAAARNAFSDLASEYGLTELGSDVHSVHYQGPPGWLAVTHDPRSYELDISFTPAEGGSDRPFGMVDFLRLGDKEQAERYRSFAGTSADGVRSGVQQLADRVRRYAGPALTGDRSFLARLGEERRDAAAEMDRMAAQAGIKQAAEEAMQHHDWSRIIELYEPLEPQLSRVERKRLDLARKRLLSQ